MSNPRISEIRTEKSASRMSRLALMSEIRTLYNPAEQAGLIHEMEKTTKVLGELLVRVGLTPSVIKNRMMWSRSEIEGENIVGVIKGRNGAKVEARIAFANNDNANNEVILIVTRDGDTRSIRSRSSTFTENLRKETLYREFAHSKEGMWNNYVLKPAGDILDQRYITYPPNHLKLFYTVRKPYLISKMKGMIMRPAY